MEELADGIVDVGKWLVVAGIVMFVGGFLMDAFGVKRAGPGEDGEEEKSPLELLWEIILKAWAVAFDRTGKRSTGQRVSAGGVLLIGLGLFMLLAGFLAALAADGADGGDGDPTPSPSPS